MAVTHTNSLLFEKTWFPYQSPIRQTTDGVCCLKYIREYHLKVVKTPAVVVWEFWRALTRLPSMALPVAGPRELPGNDGNRWLRQIRQGCQLMREALSAPFRLTKWCFLLSSDGHRSSIQSGDPGSPFTAKKPLPFLQKRQGLWMFWCSIT